MFNQHCTEPSLDELFEGLAMQRLMRRDGVTESDVRALLCELKDIRAAALGGIKRKPVTDASAGHAEYQGEMALRSPEAKIQKAEKIPLRFI